MNTKQGIIELNNAKQFGLLEALKYQLQITATEPANSVERLEELESNIEYIKQILEPTDYNNQTINKEAFKIYQKLIEQNTATRIQDLPF